MIRTPSNKSIKKILQILTYPNILQATSASFKSQRSSQTGRLLIKRLPSFEFDPPRSSMAVVEVVVVAVVVVVVVVVVEVVVALEVVVEAKQTTPAPSCERQFSVVECGQSYNESSVPLH